MLGVPFLLFGVSFLLFTFFLLFVEGESCEFCLFFVTRVTSGRRLVFGVSDIVFGMSFLLFTLFLVV